MTKQILKNNLLIFCITVFFWYLVKNNFFLFLSNIFPSSQYSFIDLPYLIILLVLHLLLVSIIIIFNKEKKNSFKYYIFSFANLLLIYFFWILSVSGTFEELIFGIMWSLMPISILIVNASILYFIFEK